MSILSQKYQRPKGEEPISTSTSIISLLNISWCKVVM
jgi:hypothetical protein